MAAQDKLCLHGGNVVKLIILKNDNVIKQKEAEKGYSLHSVL